ncbi:type II toxin-antitoxin system HipA family toxin [Cellulomonas humilata]|uniref:Serine/threonine-protein kinase HipA n=1 Tax=Cellulomonas humilata TaxID=144055 RepID=A0ABU0EI31_9CELL|nr:HipA domain-containing protein [Cellulomonas humilata]MDQ0374867.1 serine/threonine-protein kinase HipA [Cellulomonas humilata]
MSTALDVWLYGTRAGTLTSRDGRLDLAWSDDAVARWGAGSRVASHLLPLATAEGSHPARVGAWLEGLLPEGRTRTAMAVDHGIDPDDTLGILGVYGKDTAGALVLVDEGAPDPATTAHLEPVDRAQVAAMLRQSASSGTADTRLDSLTSLAGMEPKVALAWHDGGWARVRAGAASTHIIKLSRSAQSPTRDLIDTEAASLDLARRIGLTSVDARIEQFDEVRAIVVSRYDRVVSDGPTERIHQEDLAQALGINTSDPERKFQRGRSLPSYVAAARVLTDGGARTDELLRLVTFTVAIGNTDAHAKNHSFVRHPDGARLNLAPAYDISMHEHTSVSSGRLAMEVSGKDAIASITAEDLADEGRSWGMAPRRAQRVVAQTVQAIADALSVVDRDGHPGVSAAAWETVERRVRALGP